MGEGGGKGNPSVSEADVREMLIQHILTEEIFAHVFDQGDFHRENNIAKELYALEAMFFTGATKRNTLKSVEPYYAAIRANAALDRLKLILRDEGKICGAGPVLKQIFEGFTDYAFSE
jgi:predicted helicase